MFLDHFQLTVNPFGLSPKLDFLYRSGAFEESMAHLIYGLENSEAIVMITGAIGTGKSMAIQSFLTHLSSSFEFALVTNTRVSSIEFLKLVLEDLGIDIPPNSDKSDLLIKFKDFLHETFKRGGRVLIVVDEAQNLDVDVLEEVRLMTNLGQGDLQPVQVILLGQPELCETVSKPELAQLRQRIRVHYKLATLSLDELEGYVDHRMTTAGGQAGVFSKKALGLIYKYSGGVPRLVNSLCGNALLAAFVAERHKVLPEDVSVDEIPALVDLTKASAPASEGAPVIQSKLKKKSRKVEVRDDDDEQQFIKFPPRERDRGKSGFRPIIVAVLLLVILTPVILWQLGYLEGIFPSGSPTGTGVFPGPVVEEQEAHPSLEPAKQEIAQESSSKDDASNVPEPEGTVDEGLPEEAKETVIAVQVSPTLPVTEQSPAVDNGVNKEEVEKTSAPTPQKETAVFAAHIASFRDMEKTTKYLESISDVAPNSFFRIFPGQGRDWYRIYLGPFKDQGETEAVAGRLKEMGKIPYFNVIRMTDADLIESIKN
jgi:type II secretory pathway predicted ATPase ExeA/cell division septation protein DedD